VLPCTTSDVREDLCSVCEPDMTWDCCKAARCRALSLESCVCAGLQPGSHLRGSLRCMCGKTYSNFLLKEGY
jgi:hypothetical protein